MRIGHLLPALAVGAVAGTGALLVAHGGTEPAAVAGAGSSAIGEVASNAEGLRGDRVVLTGVVDEVYGRRAFALGDDTGAEVVVLLPERRSENVERVTSGTVRVSGTVRRIGLDLRGVLRGDYLVRLRTAGIDADAVDRVERRRGAAGSTPAP